MRDFLIGFRAFLADVRVLVPYFWAILATFRWCLMFSLILLLRPCGNWAIAASVRASVDHPLPWTAHHWALRIVAIFTGWGLLV